MSGTKAEGISRAEAVRRAVASFVPAAANKKHRLRDHPAFGSWSGRKVDPVEFVRTLRTEWDHRSV